MGITEELLQERKKKRSSEYKPGITQQLLQEKQANREKTGTKGTAERDYIQEATQGDRLAEIARERTAAQEELWENPIPNVRTGLQQAALWRAGDETLKSRTRDYYAREIPRLTAALRDAGYSVRPTCANFFLVETPDDEDFIRFMLERGIVVRHTRNFAGLDGKFVRIAARTKDEDDLLIAAAREYARTLGVK